MGQREVEDLSGGAGTSRLGPLAVIVSSSDDAIVGMDRDGVVTSWNPAASRMYGWTAQEIVGRRGTVLCPPERVAEFTGALAAIVGGEQIVRYRTVRLRKDRTTVPVSVTMSPVRDSSGTLIGASSIARGITGHQRAEARLAQADDLELTCRNLEAFCYSVSHDLRAPLGAMAGYSEALLEESGEVLGEAGRCYAERIRAGSEQLMTLIDKLLMFCLSSRAVLRFLPVDLSAEVSAAIEELRARDPGRQVTVTIQDGVWVSADRDLIRSVVRNLVDNAWKFTSGRDDAHIEFWATPIGNARVRCHVRDDGAGFDPAYAGCLFQPFQRLHPVPEYPGTGVGLAVVRQIIERHGGEVGAEGTLGAGAAFSFTLDAEEAT